MITIREAEEILKKEYHRDNFLYLVDEILLSDFKADKHPVIFQNDIFVSVTQLGVSAKCDITIYEVVLKTGAEKRRVAITQQMFRILRGQGINNALVAFANADKNNYRISLLTSKYEFDGDKVVKVISNPRRFSYSLGFGTKTKTAYKFLIEKGKVNSLEELTSRFSVEVVNKQFYSEIATCFTELVGGERDGRLYEPMLNIYSVVDRNKYSEFAVRLIGRIMFCWFLREKRSPNGTPLVPDDILAIETIRKSRDYYHEILEPLFFELLNTNQSKRKKCFDTDYYKLIPYLNGGLFSPHADDHYKFDTNLNCGASGVITIPNQWFIDLYTTLGQYNFTVDENTAYDIELSIDPEMLGRIFENLLAEINPETGENAKKSTGSFYTPRDIVDYMVDTSLCEYLNRKTKIDEVRLRALISYSKEDDDLAVFTTDEKKKLIDALYTVTIIDPACGSGAFPIGMLQKVVYILQEIDPEANLWFDKATENIGVLLKKEFEKKFNAGSLNYIRKLSVIQNSIFGVDIQSIAVEISRLRCFLSLIIEEKVDDKEENRGINALPNLDFKFVAANTLLPLGDEGRGSMFEKDEHIEELRTIREEFFSADIEERDSLKYKFSLIQNKMYDYIYMSRIGLASARYQKLFQWKPFENQATDWFDPMWMFGISNGFDIVIGNPPYIQLQKSISANDSTKYGDLYIKCKYATFAKTGDMYCLFYERGYQLLKEGGILTYITSNKWMRAGYGELLRSFLTKKTNPLLLIDFAGQKIFETATVDVNILSFEKALNVGHTLACTADETCRNNLSVFVQQRQTKMSFVGGDSWVILSPIEQSIKSKIEKYGVPLKDWNVSINYGVKTGFNDAFIIDGAKRAQLIEQDPKSAEIIRPILRGRDIKRYGYEFADLWLICTHNGIKERGIRAVNVENYPAIKEHLDKYYKEIKKRQDQGDSPYNLRNCAYWDDFSKQKIIYPETTQEANFFFDTGKFYIDKTCFIMISKYPEYLIATLSSTLFEYAYKRIFSSIELGVNGYQYNKHALLKLPIVVPENVDDEIYNKIKTLVVNILSILDPLEKEHIKNEIDNLIYKIYNINATEQQYINVH